MAAIFGVSGRWLNPPYDTDATDGEHARAKLRNRFLFDEHLLRDIGFREEVSRFHRSRRPGF
ncbi:MULTISPECIES: hypothetical protein [Rhizobium/Agrobacterium group]|uniref:DUF1127 domain-containing protein n=2 Tax=Neorhizobium TaxID=1525371 RepID=A0ABV0MCE1_9HYPH|nr:MULTISPECIES: hypothetical protein [Rhizobium/Agrobacterium group]KGD98579.1 hypothetical protein JL39_14035 [Rhizobium sp. YS-1r]MCC2609688.1 hypothetical protein [Neorhizobium petrolearium]WGI69885.1 hypothetical protein QEO92_07455 [Neorhizobium petrolearium]